MQPFARQSVHIDRADTSAGFRCVEPELEAFFQDEAVRYEDRGFSRTFVLRRGQEDPPEYPPILGYYTICMARLTPTDLPDELRSSWPPHAVPAALLGRMARDERVPRELRLGEVLVGEAMRRILAVEQEIGCAVVVLDAMNSSLERYYADTFGFIPTKRKRTPQTMFLPLATVRAARDQQ